MGGGGGGWVIISLVTRRQKILFGKDVFLQVRFKFVLQHVHYVYVIAWVAVQFGMNCTSNATRKELIA